MSRFRIKANKREIRELLLAADRQLAVMADETAKPEAKVEAAHRLAEINLRINLLEMDNQKL